MNQEFDKINNDADRQFISDRLTDFDVLGFMSQNPKIAEADRRGVSPFDIDSQVVSEVKEIRERLESLSK